MLFCRFLTLLYHVASSNARSAPQICNSNKQNERLSFSTVNWSAHIFSCFVKGPVDEKTADYSPAIDPTLLRRHEVLGFDPVGQFLNKDNSRGMIGRLCCRSTQAFPSPVYSPSTRPAMCWLWWLIRGLQKKTTSKLAPLQQGKTRKHGSSNRRIRWRRRPFAFHIHFLRKERESE